MRCKAVNDQSAQCLTAKLLIRVLRTERPLGVVSREFVEFVLVAGCPTLAIIIAALVGDRWGEGAGIATFLGVASLLALLVGWWLLAP